MVSCLMGDSTALASAIVRCCLSNISTNIGREVVICNSTSSDKAIAILQGEVDRLKKEVEDLKKQNDESNHSVR